jgi:glycine/D-amino acid oxidase-like deaminating enzyme
MRAGRLSYDTVIVGGGHNGLVAAAYLARADRSCLLLERRQALGGAAVSEEVFPGVAAKLSRYSYLVSLLPELIVGELGLGVRLLPRRISSHAGSPPTRPTRARMGGAGCSSTTAIRRGRGGPSARSPGKTTTTRPGRTSTR